MKFSNCLKLAMVVGLAASAASAGDRVAMQPRVAAPVFKGTIDMVTGTISQYGSRVSNTSAYDNVGDFADGTPGVIDVTTGDPADFYFVGGGTASSGDWITLDRRNGGRGVFGDNVVGYLDSVIFGSSYDGDGSQTEWLVDDYQLFFDDLVTWDEAGTLADITRGSFAGGFYFADLPSPDFTATGSFYAYSATGLIDAGITVTIDDNALVYQHIYSVTGSGGTPVVDPLGMHVHNGDGTATGTDGGNYLGASIDLFLVDADASGLYNGTEWRYYYGGGPFVANSLINLGVYSCDADFDGSGFVDLDDFNAFVPAFEGGC
ncbi:MAG: hypothetical protein IT435_13065 [Phycisphaerales bacterium]|nr:hypothetical protein [Phycisphaerales bacterium]